MIGQTFSHYRILRQIGEGGMGVVYVAEDTQLGRRVAVKFPLAGPEEGHYRARFLREARAVSSLNHPHIASVYDFGETDGGQPYIVMELVAGHSLAELLAEGMTLGRAVEIIQDVAAALGEAHRRGVVHRDIKPTNVHVNDQGQVKVLDFGLAKHIEETALAGDDGAAATHLRTRSDVVIGTPLYLSPEQARGAPVDARSDLFALGALLYECVAGRPPFSGSNVIEIGAQVIHVEPPPPSRTNPRVPPELDRVTLKALAKRPEERFQTADEMIAALEPVRLRLGGNEAARTRRLPPGEADALGASALVTISRTLSRPRFSPLALIAALLVAAAGLWGYTAWRIPAGHRPTGEAQEFYERGAAALRDGAYHRASLALSEAVRLDERFALARARLAEAWTELDFLERAKDEMLRVLELVPSRDALPEEEALYLDAIRATVGRQHRAAAEAYARIVERRPQSAETYVDLARAQEKNDEVGAAVNSLTEATRRDPEYATAYLRLGALYGRQQNFAPASTAFERAERIYTARGDQEGRAEVLYQRGLLLNNTGRHVEARRDIEQSLELARAAGNHYQQAQALLQLSSISLSELKHAQAVADANAAIEIAQAGGMPSLTVRGHIALGSIHFTGGNYAEAEKSYERARHLAAANRLRRLEAQALFNLGSLLLGQGRVEQGLRHVEQAREYYEQGGYRKESMLAVLLLGRTRRRAGDYEGALRTFEEQLRLAEPAGDMQQVGDIHRELGTVQLMRGQAPAALRHFRESHAIYKSLGGQQGAVANILVKQADALWRVGSPDDARAKLEEAAAIAAASGPAGKEMLAFLNNVWAHLALSQQRFPEAAAKASAALAAGAPSKDVSAEARRAACAAALHTGARAGALALCEEAVRQARETGDPLFVARAQTTLAEALRQSGDAGAALAAAADALAFFARVGASDAEWRAAVVAARAAQRAGDGEALRRHAAHAEGALARLKESWGVEASAGFLARPDIKELYRWLSGLTNAAAPEASR